MGDLKIKLLVVFTLLLLSLSVSSVAAQYTTQVTSDVLVTSDGTVTIVDEVGVTYEIQGVPGATGTVTTAVYNGNPQATATIPSGTTLTYFIVVTFNMNANDFTSAQITIPYTDADVAGANAPYSVFKYMPNTNSFVELTGTTDTAAKTITITVTSIEDPLFAIGGASTATGVTDTTSWIIIAVSVVVIVLLAVFIIRVLRKR